MVEKRMDAVMDIARAARECQAADGLTRGRPAAEVKSEKDGETAYAVSVWAILAQMELLERFCEAEGSVQLLRSAWENYHRYYHDGDEVLVKCHGLTVQYGFSLSVYENYLRRGRQSCR